MPDATYVELIDDQIITIDAEQWRAETLHRKPHIDFNAVSFAHEPIHERLTNWARWVRPRASSWVHPMWRNYKPDNWYRVVSENSGLDPLDAQAVEKGVSALPDAHKFAIRWCYVYGGQPRKAAQHVGESLEGLQVLIVQGRSMLINRRI